MACDIATLVAENPQLNSLDKVGVQAAKLYILALILKQLGGEDRTDICAFVDSLRGHDGYSGYQTDSAILTSYIRLAEAYGVTLDDAVPGAGYAVVACSHCCGVTNKAMQNAEAQLLCEIADNVHP